MERDEDETRSHDEIAVELASAAGEYRRAAALLADVGGLFGESEMQSNPTLKIVFSSVVSYIDEGANQLERAVSRLAGSAEGGPASERLLEAERTLAEPSVASVRLREDAPEALRAVAGILGEAMNRAFDLAEESGDEELTGDPHPFGHVIQGICLPYILLAADSLG